MTASQQAGGRVVAPPAQPRPPTQLTSSVLTPFPPPPPPACSSTKSLTHFSILSGSHPPSPILLPPLHSTPVTPLSPKCTSDGPGEGACWRWDGGSDGGTLEARSRGTKGKIEDGTLSGVYRPWPVVEGMRACWALPGSTAGAGHRRLSPAVGTPHAPFAVCHHISPPRSAYRSLAVPP